MTFNHVRRSNFWKTNVMSKYWLMNKRKVHESGNCSPWDLKEETAPAKEFFRFSLT